MAYGTINVDTLTASTGVLATQNGMTGIAKAWVQFLGASGTINGSFNISSVTRNSTGQYTVNFTTAMANANYAISVAASPNSAGTVNGGLNTIFTSGGAALSTPTTTSFQFICFSVSVVGIDPNWVCVTVNGS
jgi:hypothetical protein